MALNFSSDMSAGFMDGPTGYEPQRANNGVLSLNIPGGAGNTNLIELAVTQFPMPKVNNGIVQVPHLNEDRKFAGRPNFDDITATFTDFLDVDIAQAIYSWRIKVYNPTNGKIGLARDYKADGFMTTFAPDGSRARSWRVIGIWPSAMDPGDIDHSSDDYVRVSVTFSVDKAVLAR